MEKLSPKAGERQNVLAFWDAAEHCRVGRAWAQRFHANPAVHEFGAEDRARLTTAALQLWGGIPSSDRARRPGRGPTLPDCSGTRIIVRLAWQKCRNGGAEAQSVARGHRDR